MPKHHRSEVNWERMEDRIRRALRRYVRAESTTDEVLRQIDDAVGDETGRGHELMDED